jgi:hypothetical protein
MNKVKLQQNSFNPASMESYRCQKLSNILDYKTPMFYSQPSENVHLVIIFRYISGIIHLVRGRFPMKLIKLKLQDLSPTRAHSMVLGGALAIS